MKKAQVAGQIFIYILAVVIVVGIIAYGYSAIKGFGKKSEQVEYIQLKTDMENSFKSIINDYGSIKRPQMFIPSKYEKVCFVDASKWDATTTNLGLCNPPVPENDEYEPIICTTWETPKNEINAFLVPDGSDNFAILGPDKLTFDSSCGSPIFCCFDVINNRINLQLEGRGDSVRISKY